MTAQITDKFLYKGEKYELIGIKGDELVEPEQFGMEAAGFSTACWRGFYATYELTDSVVILRELSLWEINENYVPIAGVKPEKNERDMAHYHNLNVTVPFTGKIRLAKDFGYKYYIHMGYQKATAFKTVLDIQIQDGKVVEVKDRSAEIKQKQGEFQKHYYSKDTDERINEAFSLDMDLE